MIKNFLLLVNSSRSNIIFLGSEGTGSGLDHASSLNFLISKKLCLIGLAKDLTVLDGYYVIYLGQPTWFARDSVELAGLPGIGGFLNTSNDLDKFLFPLPLLGNHEFSLGFYAGLVINALK